MDLNEKQLIAKKAIIKFVKIARKNNYLQRFNLNDLPEKKAQAIIHNNYNYFLSINGFGNKICTITINHRHINESSLTRLLNNAESLTDIYRVVDQVKKFFMLDWAK